MDLHIGPDARTIESDVWGSTRGLWVFIGYIRYLQISKVCKAKGALESKWSQWEPVEIHRDL